MTIYVFKKATCFKGWTFKESNILLDKDIANDLFINRHRKFFDAVVIEGFNEKAGIIWGSWRVKENFTWRRFRYYTRGSEIKKLISLL